MDDARRRLGVVVTTFLLIAVAREGTAQVPAAEIPTGTNIPIASGATLVLRAVNGEVSFLSAPGDQAIIEYARDVPAAVKIVTLTTPDGVTICTVYASTDPKKPTECLPGGKGRLAAGRIRDQPRVKFRIRVPAGVHVSASIDQGDLKSAGITGNQRLYSNNGDVLVWDAGGPGTIDAGTGLLGGVDAVIAKVQNGPGNRQVKLATVGSGKVRVALPTSVGASYNVSTQVAAVFDPVFKVEKNTPPLISGHVGPPGDSVVRLQVETGIAGQFVLLPAK